MSQPDRSRFSRRVPLSLATLLVTAVLLPFLVVVGVTGWYSISLLERATEDRMQEDIELIARAIRQPLSHALDQGYDRTVREALESAFNIDRVYGVFVYDEAGNTIYSNGAHDTSMSNMEAADLANRGERQGEFGQAGDERIFSYFVPLVDAGERITGLLQVTRRGQDFDRYLNDVRRRGTVLVAIAAVALALIVFLGHRWSVGRHLRSVEGSLSRVGAGEVDHRLAPQGPRELHALAASINQMLDALGRFRGELAEQKDREAALTASLHQSQKLAALGQLAAGVAHELGSPLSTVDGNTQRALRQADVPQGLRRSLESIRREAARMERIIRQLLDYGRTNPLNRRPVHADYPLRTAVAALREELGDIPVQVECPGAVGRTLVRVDLVRLEQALGNLLRNAVQAARGRVLVQVADTGDAIQYCVDDDGPGIDADTEQRLFEPFFTTKPTGEGTGLGLAVAHAAVRDHGGGIEVGTSPLGGARLCVSLPRRGEDG